EVLSVSKRFRLFASSFTVFRYKVEVVGEVTKVHKSASGLKVRSRITIRYDGYAYNSIPFQFQDQGQMVTQSWTRDMPTRHIWCPTATRGVCMRPSAMSPITSWLSSRNGDQGPAGCCLQLSQNLRPNL